MTSRWLVLPLALLLVALLSPAAWAQERERITDFHSEITIREDAVMEVTETITVMVQGFEIKRGIIRDFPTKYKTTEGKPVTVWFKLKEVRRDGVPEPYEESSKANGVSIRIGNPEYYLPYGEHTYTIMYETSRQLGFFEGKDELYWNVTGNGWTFTMDRASAEVILPGGVDASGIRTLAFTGAYGSHGDTYVSAVEGNHIYFETTAQLWRFEGLTIVVQWPPGVVARPTQAQLVRYWLIEHLIGLLCLLSIVVVVLYYYLAWLRVGVDPHGGFIMPEQIPPNGLSPAALRYISRMYSDRKCFTTALISMATRGYLTIEEDKGDYTLIQKDESVKLTPEEAAASKKLFMRGQNFRKINQDNRTGLVSAQTALAKSLKQQFEGVYFNRNTRWQAAGMWLSLAFGIITLAALAVPHVGFPVLVLILTGIAHFVMYAVFATLLPAYTNLGRAFLDRIEGFKLALSGGTDDLGEEHAGSGTLAEAFLPYAIALEVHTPWSQRFEKALKLQSERMGQSYTGYHPIWYSGNWSDFDSSGTGAFSNFSSKFTSSFNSEISSASTPPSSSSGGGGSGFSGGGGGGGGGSGW